MMKRYIAVSLLVLVISLSFTGCFGMGGSYGAPQSTIPPQQDFKSVDELSAAVAAARTADSATDEVKLKDLTNVYVLKTPPEGAAISYIKVSAGVVRVGYAFGATSDQNFDNQMELAWYRNADKDKFLSDTAQQLGTYDTIKIGDLDYIHAIPTFQFASTPEPGSTALATPTPRAGTYCQFVYWMQDSAAFMSAVPLTFTQDDIGKYCLASKVEIK